MSDPNTPGSDPEAPGGRPEAAGAGSTSPLDQFEELLFECLDLHEAGGDQAVSEFLGRHPQHAQALRTRLDALRQSGLLSREDSIPERLGDFEVLERLGEGGMGVVYRAHQTSLGREVALKLIRPEHLYFSGARERFRREVETIASLHHPGIVAVYSVGEDGGVPYFAMELVRGSSVEELLGRLRGRPLEDLRGSDLDPTEQGTSYLFTGSWEEACLRVVRQVCEALEFAHRNGVLHRDLKPSNMMISAEGTARALLLDFGLARGSGSDKLTRTGSQLGSLRYMAPEQLRGDPEAIGPATDVYGLGVSLFEMLTLTPAFEGSQAEVAMAVTQRGLPRLRTRNPHASWEVETIVATATDPDPRRRYASAADMARDLANALERRPIEARRAGALLRLRRWVQRNPSQAVASVLGLLLLLGVPSAYAWQQRRSSIALAAQRDRAVLGFEKAMLAVDRMLARVGAVDLAYVPAMEGLRRSLLEDAVELLEEVVAEGGADISFDGKLQLASTRKRLGQLLASLGRPTEAVPQFDAARTLLDELLLVRPGHVPTLDLRASVTIEEAGMQVDAGELEQAIALMTGLEQDLEREGAGENTETYLAHCLGTRAWALSRRGDHEPALADFRRACALADRILAGDDVSLEDRIMASLVWNNHGNHWLDRSQSSIADEGFEALQRAVELTREVRELSPNPLHNQILCSSLNNLAGAYRRRGEFEAARARLEQARTLMETLVRDYPETLTFRMELATLINQMGMVEDYQDRHELSHPYYVEAAGHLEVLRDMAPDEPFYHQRYAVTQFNVSYGQRERGEIVEAEASIARGIEAARRAIELDPDRVEYRETLADLLRVQSQGYAEVGDHAAMARCVDEMVEVHPDPVHVWHRGAWHYAQAYSLALNDEWIDEDERQEAAAHYAERACELTRGAIQRGPDYPDVRQMQNLQALHGLPVFEELAAWQEAWLAEHPRPADSAPPEAPAGEQ